MEEIKGCPCCGHEVRFYQVGPKMIISCPKCGIKLEKMYGNKANIISDWNKRVN